MLQTAQYRVTGQGGGAKSRDPSPHPPTTPRILTILSFSLIPEGAVEACLYWEGKVKRSRWKRARDRECNGNGRGDDVIEPFQTI